MGTNHDLSGQWVHGFEIVRKLGGTSPVYLGEAENPNNKLYTAVKHITLPDREQYCYVLEQMDYNRALTDAYFFRAAADIASEIGALIELSTEDSRHIVAYYEHDIKKTGNPLRFDILIRMEYLVPLSRHIKDNGFTVKDILQLGIDICAALTLCHSKGIIHRGLKESKIFISQTNDFKLGGFCIANGLAESVKPTASDYDSREAYRWDPHGISADIYALGIVMYRLLNNRRMPFMPDSAAFDPCDTASAEVMRLSGAALPKPLHSGQGLGDIVLKACAQNGERYENADEFGKDLMRYLCSLSDEEKNKVIIMPQPGAQVTLKGSSAITVRKIAKPNASQAAYSNKMPDKHVNNRRKGFKANRLALVISAFLIVLSCCVMATGFPRDNWVEIFMDTVKAGGYDEANAIYREKLSGNPQKSGKAAQLLEEYAGKVAEDYINDKLRYEYAVSVLQAIDDTRIADIRPYMKAIAGEEPPSTGTLAASPTPAPSLPYVTPTATPQTSSASATASTPAPTRIPTYRLTFETNGGNAVESIRLNSDTIISGSQFVTSRFGYVFRAWYTDSALTREFTAGKLNGNMVLYAGWDIIKYNVTFDFGDGNPEVRAFAFNEKISSPPARARDGVPANSWEITWRLNGKDYAMGKTTDKDITLTASWRRLVRLSFDTNGGNQISAIELSYSTIPEDKLPANPKKEGYIFDGWYEDNACTQRFSPKEILLENKTLYAKWKQAI